MGLMRSSSHKISCKSAHGLWSIYIWSMLWGESPTTDGAPKANQRLPPGGVEEVGHHPAEQRKSPITPQPSTRNNDSILTKSNHTIIIMIEKSINPSEVLIY